MGERGPQPGEGGAPRKAIDIEVARRAAALGCTATEIAQLLGIGRQTFYDHCKQDPALQGAIDEGRDQGRTTLRRLQWQRAHAGSDTMLIWLGKQLLGQRDKHEVEQTGPPLTFQHLTAMRRFSDELAAERAATERQPLTINGARVAEGGVVREANESTPAPRINLYEPATE